MPMSPPSRPTARPRPPTSLHRVARAHSSVHLPPATRRRARHAPRGPGAGGRSPRHRRARRPRRPAPPTPGDDGPAVVVGASASWAPAGPRRLDDRRGPAGPSTSIHSSARSGDAHLGPPARAHGRPRRARQSGVGHRRLDAGPACSTTTCAGPSVWPRPRRRRRRSPSGRPCGSTPSSSDGADRGLTDAPWSDIAARHPRRDLRRAQRGRRLARAVGDGRPRPGGPA